MLVTIIVIKYCISVLHSLLYNLLEIFIFRKISKVSKIYFWYLRIENIKNITIYSKISYFPPLVKNLRFCRFTYTHFIHCTYPSLVWNPRKRAPLYCIVEILRYSIMNSWLPLKSGLTVIQGNWKWHVAACLVCDCNKLRLSTWFQ